MSTFLWLPSCPDWQQRLAAVSKMPENTWPHLIALANTRIGFAETLQLDRLLQRHYPACPPELTSKPVRLALLGSATTEHLLPGLRVGALRRGVWLTIYTTPYGQYAQELADPDSGLHQFKPDIVLFALEAAHLLAEGDTDIDAACDRLCGLWDQVMPLGCTVFQQTFLPMTPALLGNNDHRLKSSPHALCSRLNERLRSMADQKNVHLVALDDCIVRDGLAAWHDPVYWHRAKQAVRPLATPSYGDMVARLIVALQGWSFKALVLDLDNTLWGGVIGEDGLDGIKLGQGDAVGEAYITFQTYIRDLARRGIILAVCSKNEGANALAVFDRHPEMILKRDDIACFIANWQDKATNLRVIAERLNIGLDSLVFVDDDPFERNIVRRELPMVGVPEMPEDPVHFAQCLADTGYFEALHITDDDRIRTQDYQANSRRENLRVTATDLDGYLKSLKMELQWGSFDPDHLTRIVQLINKTNQFNLTTRRYTDMELKALMMRTNTVTLQLRLRDQFGDNGVIGALIGILHNNGELEIDSWLMSCRVLGRGVENASLNILAQAAKRRGARCLIGNYIPTPKNAMVKDHYEKMGFVKDSGETDRNSRWRLLLESFTPYTTHISMQEVLG